MSNTKRYNSRGNWWYEGDVCKEEGCDTLIDSCDNEYTYHGGKNGKRRILVCREHYRKLHRERQSNHYQLNNAVNARAIKKAGGQAAYDDLPKSGKERKKLRAEARAEILSEKEQPDNILQFTPKTWTNKSGELKTANGVTPEFTNSYEEVTTVSKGRKRDQKVVSHIRDVYDACSVEGCDYPLYDVAHIHALKHGADDLPGNCIPLCPNHHRDLDRGRLLLADPADRSATDPIGFLIGEEEGRIILDEGHDVDSKYIEGCIREIDEYLSKRESY